MKKILLGTTTLIGAAGLVSGIAFADTPKVTVGGYENFEVGYVRDDMDSAGNASQNGVSERPQAFRNDTQVDFKIDGKSDNGLGYGGEIDLLADTSADVQNRGFNASKTFIYLDGMWGRFEMGSNVGADGTMKVDAGTIARATGGIDGDWSYFANANTQFVAMSSLPLGYGNYLENDNFTGDHSEENLNKITYYTPRFAGFQLGVSYLPDQINRGQGYTGSFATNGSNGIILPNGPDRTDKNSNEAQNIFTGGINYDNKFGDIGVNLAATGEYGHAELSTDHNLAAWEAGGKLSWEGFSVAGSYGNWEKSNQTKADDAGKSWFWDVGGAYEVGPFGASVTYIDSKYGLAGDVHNNFSNVVVGVDYKLAPGLTPYAEVSFYNENAAAVINADDNKGTVGIIGTQLNF